MSIQWDNNTVWWKGTTKSSIDDLDDIQYYIWLDV